MLCTGLNWIFSELHNYWMLTSSIWIALQYHEHTVFAWRVSVVLLNLLMAILLASALLVCSPPPLLASPPHFWTLVDMFAVGGQFSGPVLFFLCGSAAVCCRSSPVWNLPPNWVVQLSVAPSSSCVDLHSDWFVQLSLVLDLTMWPRLLWHHMVPSSARDRRAHTHLPLPASHTPWSHTKLRSKYFGFRVSNI